MQQHLEQASHNLKFHKSIESSFEGQFYDWRITVLFYVAIHYLKALAVHRGCAIGDTHFEIEKNVNPDRDNANMRISKNAWREYKSLLQYSQTARYNGITDINTFQELKRIDHSYCLVHLDKFKKYVVGQGVEIKE